MTDGALWQEFLDYIDRAGPADHPGVIFQGFGRDRVAHGATPDEAQAAVRDVLARTRTRSDWTTPVFDRIYSSPTPPSRADASAFLRRVVAGRTPGRALDIAMGQGRNAVHLAGAGWDVTGFDPSGQGVRAARAAAAERGVSIEGLVARSEDFDYGTSRWDLVVAAYALVPLTQPRYAAMLVASMRPGGLLIVDTFAPDPVAPGGRPVEADPAALGTAYAALDTIVLETVEDVADWTGTRQPVVHFAATRRA